MNKWNIRTNIAVKLNIDNKSSINLARNLISHGKNKHIKAIFHFFIDEFNKEFIDEFNKEKLIVEYCPTQGQLEDLCWSHQPGGLT